jgi:YfiH family protein
MLLRSELLSSAGFSHGFPTRDTPDAALRDALGARPIVQVKQVHGARVVLATEAKGAEGDALVSRAADRLPVGVRVADCVPVLVGDVRAGDVAAIHAGWRGVVAGVVGEGVRLLAPEPDRGELVAAIGPCIGPCCFEVGREVGAQLGFVVREVGDKVFVDLRAAVRAQLEGLGVRQVDDVPGCTKHEPERFHSFRRDGANSGRMLAAIAPRPA